MEAKVSKDKKKVHSSPTAIPNSWSTPGSPTSHVLMRISLIFASPMTVDDHDTPLLVVLEMIPAVSKKESR
jgi:hypothetical protein